jgi:type I restriction enzyme S subunit
VELKLGCQKTEVGILPNNWEIVPIGDVIAEFRGGAPFAPSDFTESGVKVLRKGGVGRSGWLEIHAEEIQYCSEAYAQAHCRNQVDEMFTIVVLRDLVPSGPSIGQMVQIKGHDTFILAQGVYGFKVNRRAVPGYLVQLSNTRWYRKLANSIMVGSTQVHITNAAFKSALIPLPPPKEQEAIAKALTDADALIESLEQLLAKKRLLKQGAMQELLTGKKRLPGFTPGSPSFQATNFGQMPSDWNLTPLHQVSAFITKGSTPTTYGFSWQSAGILFLRSECVSETGLDPSVPT